MFTSLADYTNARGTNIPTPFADLTEIEYLTGSHTLDIQPE